ncbi:MAG: hypothetical protein EOM10_07650 [Opitutae bacterium]|nr:hypothetical protein [Opitutae bacterium]
MKCGHCGSGITAEEKFKKLLDGSVRRYVYYGCGRSKNQNCKNGYIREDGRMVHDMYLVEVKTPEESADADDLFRVAVEGLFSGKDLHLVIFLNSDFAGFHCFCSNHPVFTKRQEPEKQFS